MARIRIWHASRDPYHCAFRFIRLLLTATDGRLHLDRLRLLDMFLLYPVLLHDVSMPQQVKMRFRELRIPNVAETFTHLPGPAVLAQDLRVYQSAAVSQLAARGILAAEPLGEGFAELKVAAVPGEIVSRAVSRDDEQPGLLGFLVVDLEQIPLAGRDGLLRRAAVTSLDRLS